MSVQINGITLESRQIIKFQTEHPTDSNLYEGEIVSIGSYEGAYVFSEVDAYHNEVVKVLTALPGARDLDYIVLKRTTGEVVAIAAQWVTVASFTLVTQTEHKLIQVLNVSQSEITNIIGMIKDAGHTAIQL